MSHRQQTDLDRQVARRLGESVREIARRGFSLCRVLDDEEPPFVDSRDRHRIPAIE